MKTQAESSDGGRLVWKDLVGLAIAVLRWRYVDKIYDSRAK